MRVSTASGPRLGRRALNRALLARQHLLHRSDAGPLAMIEHLVGMQAQNPNAPYVGLWTRLNGFGHADLADLLTGRRATRTALMRNTVHLTSAVDCHALRAVLQPMLDRTMRGALGPRTADLDLDAVADAAGVALAQQPLTPAELGLALARRWPDHDPTLLALVARTALPLVQVPPRGVWGVGGATRYATAHDWLGAPAAPPPPVDSLVLRYLAAFGPASVMDAQAWSGLTRLSEVFGRLAPRLRTFIDENGTVLHDLPDAPLPDPATPVPARYVAEFDNLVLGHADRSRIVADEHRPALMSRNGIVPGTVLVNGMVGGTWQITTVRGHAVLRVTPFRALARRDLATLESAGARLLGFAADRARSSAVEFAVPGAEPGRTPARYEASVAK